MIREAICEGSDVEEALERAKAQLGISDTDDYEFEVIQREEKKRFLKNMMLKLKECIKNKC